MKLWQKDTTALKEVETFTVGKDREMDMYLAPFDVLGSLAHIQMLESVGLLPAEDLTQLQSALKEIYSQIEKSDFSLQDNVEDIHSQVELLLTQKLGDAGKKIHSARSRDDQVLVDIKLFLRSEIEAMVNAVLPFFELLQTQSEKYRDHLYPGYTHLQLAMPSSFGLWFGAYAESLVDDLGILKAAYQVVNKNPLGSGAGYGSSFPLNRTYTTQLLGFEHPNYNVVYAQMTRGKSEYVVLSALSNIASTLSRMAMDVCLYNSQNFSFLILPEDLTTGSSIMPHKKNPDVAELLRAKTNRMKALPAEIAFVTSNLPSGYHRDMQLIKEILMPSFDQMLECLDITTFMISNIKVKENLLDGEKYDLLFSVENVNDLVVKGMPFRDAYRTVGNQINEGNFEPIRDLNHTLEGSIGNLCNQEISNLFYETVNSFAFEKIDAAFENLLK